MDEWLATLVDPHGPGSITDRTSLLFCCIVFFLLSLGIYLMEIKVKFVRTINILVAVVDGYFLS